jgi:hypothetical protein
MVAALACGEQRRYNAFVTTFRRELAAQASSLRRLFDRAYGSGGRRELNAFVTRLANDAATRSAGSGGYCTETGKLLTEALATSPRDFERLTRGTGLPRHLAFPRCR